VPIRPSEVVDRLRAAGCVFAEDEAALLVAAAQEGEDLDGLVEQRVAGRPLEQILGWVEFCGRRIVLEAGVFVPRRRTEFLVRSALARAGPAPLIVDLCCGSGAIGAALAAARPYADVRAADVDPAAVHCARRNLAGPVYAGDLFAALPDELQGRIDLLVVNAPYVPTDAIALMPPEAREHEPRIALDGGADGLELHRRIAVEAARWLAPAGHLLIETSVEQALRTAALLTQHGLATKVATSAEFAATVVVGTCANRGPAADSPP
jgi:release factor glutamine methyltransferase